MYAIILAGHCALIGLSAVALAQHPAPVFVAIHVACIAANVLFGLVNAWNMTR